MVTLSRANLVCVCWKFAGTISKEDCFGSQYDIFSWIDYMRTFISIDTYTESSQFYI